MLSLTVKKLDAFKFDGVAESDNTTVRSVNAKNFSNENYLRMKIYWLGVNFHF